MDLTIKDAARYLDCAWKTVTENIEQGRLQPGTENVYRGQKTVTAESVVRLRKEWEAKGRKLLPIPQDLVDAVQDAPDL